LGVVRWVSQKPDHAMLLKIMGNNLIFGVVELMNETFNLLVTAGIDAADVKRHLIDGLLPGDIFQGYAERRMVDPCATDLRSISGKDNRLGIDSGRATGVDLPLVEALGRILFP
jgi:3-hydroxyisobutyrate dehydrogenase-like beta-hydroxyacid dehydrogenase